MLSIIDSRDLNTHTLCQTAIHFTCENPSIGGKYWGDKLPSASFCICALTVDAQCVTWSLKIAILRSSFAAILALRVSIITDNFSVAEKN